MYINERAKTSLNYSNATRKTSTNVYWEKHSDKATSLLLCRVIPEKGRRKVHHVCIERLLSKTFIARGRCQILAKGSKVHFERLKSKNCEPCEWNIVESNPRCDVVFGQFREHLAESIDSDIVKELQFPCEKCLLEQRDSSPDSIQRERGTDRKNQKTSLNKFLNVYDGFEPFEITYKETSILSALELHKDQNGHFFLISGVQGGVA